ncbi:4-hydroxyphenylacetate 3-hydroxylase family protein [Lichenifustis flavocetrariae]|uniref:4-hydroxyphenylacetate 3-monooxygenase n=1 Tax=Lichenifustis flavocetrariae TaxID=2949735 RepID=A0AA41Z218_9HYPH|nr:4-hydroxyphenylacetate 3-hydroxylase N-terminal domain-containing protein [Lichenifustis flavocetrariae]MCW6507842.1 4-hydroxyphenylacetate 3-monooxygenase [Lichenifustis flavocetrariae]
MIQPAEAAADDRPLRTGAEFLDGLKRSKRTIFVNGERVSDPTRHQAFSGAARSIARLFDYAAAPENREVMTFTAPETGAPVWRCWQIPRSHDDLRAKRVAAERWAEQTFGLMGRTPDHVSNFFAGFAAKPQLFEAGGKGFGANVTNFYKFARDNHLYLAYAIVPPQIDRSKPAHQQSDPTLYAGVTRETDAGIYISGGQQLATGAVFADYLHLSCIHPLKPGDEAHAFSAVIPMEAEGLKLYSRRAFPMVANSAEDYPLTSRFDETDSFIVLEDVFVPWEHVFAYRNLAVTFDQWWKTPSHSYGNHQAQVRFATKLRFLSGIAKRLNEATGNDKAPPVMVEMGELAAYASIVENMLYAHEMVGPIDEDGIVWPSKPALYSVMALQSQINPHMIDIVRELSGAAMISLPSSTADFDNPETAADIARYFQSPEIGARDRVRLMRLAWDFIGSEFGSRHQQYEKFYGGASFLVKMNMFRSYDFKRATTMVDQALSILPA